ncbi:hypothetical protein E1287_38620 [Actinomadura sp. KC06]|nr:hypothetical protein E1287_38620 [Actinomadura sp. KC06]
MRDEAVGGAFEVKEELAWEWLLRAVMSCEMDDGHDPIGTDLPPIGMAWQPRNVGEEDTAFLLIRSAQEAGVLNRPERAELDFEYVDDGDGGYYRYLLRIDAPAPLIVASAAEEMRHLGNPDAVGIDAALAILREAAGAGNLLSQQMSAFITAVTAQRR